MRAVHFVRFGRFDQRYWNAVRVFGSPTFLHQKWDRRAAREVQAGDVVIFAKGGADQAVSIFNGDDQFYEPDIRAGSAYAIATPPATQALRSHPPADADAAAGRAAGEVCRRRTAALGQAVRIRGAW